MAHFIKKTYQILQVPPYAPRTRLISQSSSGCHQGRTSLSKMFPLSNRKSFLSISGIGTSTLSSGSSTCTGSIKVAKILQKTSSPISSSNEGETTSCLRSEGKAGSRIKIRKTYLQENLNSEYWSLVKSRMWRSLSWRKRSAIFSLSFSINSPRRGKSSAPGKIGIDVLWTCWSALARWWTKIRTFTRIWEFKKMLSPPPTQKTSVLTTRSKKKEKWVLI